VVRPLRIQYPGGFYHVTSRGNEKKAIFKGNRDRGKFLSYLESAHDRYRAIIHAYCLMGNHYHLLLETPLANLSQILHHINGAYTTYFNARMKRSGHLFQGRCKAILVEKDSQCQELSRYIHLNPVRAGLVERPSEYRWSSYRYYIGEESRPAWLMTESILGYFGQKESLAQKHYQKFTEKALGSETENPLRQVFASTVLGSPEFISWVKENLISSKGGDTRNVPAMRQLVDKPSLEYIEKVVESVVGRGHILFKKFCIYASHQYGGFSLKEIGAYYGMRGSAISQSSRRFKGAILGNEKLTKIMAEIVSKMGCIGD
jgi:putative transposase